MGLRDALRRPDWLKELQATLVLGVVVLGGFGILGAVTAIGEPVRLALRAEQVTGAVEYGLGQGAAVAPVQDLEVVVSEPSLGQRIGSVFTTLPTYAVVVALLALLLRIVWHARRSDPFHMVTVRRLRVLAVVALAGGYLAVLVEAVASFLLSETVLTGGIMASIQLDLYWLPVGFGMFAVAEVIRRGCVMRAELETVV